MQHRFTSLQAYRAIAAAAVVLHHVAGKLGAQHYFAERMPQVFSWGRLGVDFFFVLSGFIIAETVKRAPDGIAGAWSFARQRFLRIYPAFWLAFVPTLCVALVAAQSLHSPVTTNPLDLLRAALLLPFPDGGAPVIGVAWTLHHEVLFYALATLVIALPRIGMTLSAALLAGSLFFTYGFPLAFLCSPLHWEFAMGVAISLTLARPGCVLVKFFRQSWLAPLTAIVAAIGMGVYTWLWQDAPVPETVGILCFAPLFSIIVASSVQLNFEAPRLPAALGDSSYTLYLWHVPIVTPLIKLAFKLVPHAGAATLLALSLAISVCTIALAHLIYLKLERPLLAAARAWFSKTPSAARA